MSTTSIVPRSQFPLNVRAATMSDLPFIDGLQNKHYKMVGYMWTKQLEGKIKLGHVLMAETSRHPTHPHPGPLPEGEGERVGYCIGNDQYFKRDDVGIIYQMNVVPDRQRGLIGATLVKAMFDRAAWGCKLFCCWCAQDIAANYFWESVGFVPLAFRAGSRKKGRVHIFWQRRIRAGDTTTPYWFPSQTTGGSIREDRLVLPILPGTHWRDAKPLILPGATEDEPKQLPGPKERRSKPLRGLPVKPPTEITSGGLRFVVPKESVPVSKPKQKTPRVKVKNDPKHVAAARELRDRWLEKVNSGQYLTEACGKYEVGRLPNCAANQAPLLLPDARAA